MTKYLSKEPFSVHMPCAQSYKDNWEAIFHKKPDQATEDYLERRYYEACSAPQISDIGRQVREFHKAFGLPIHETPLEPTDDRVKLRLKLIAEEFCELLESCGFSPAEAHNALNKAIDNYDSANGFAVDLVAFADACGDLDYVVEGARCEFGIAGAPIAEEIHRSNCSKLVDGKPVYREDGKVVKPDTYSPADIEGCLKAQGYTRKATKC